MKKGFTFIEGIIIVAIVSIIFILSLPVIRTFGKVQNRFDIQSEIDNSILNIDEFIQENIKSAKDSGKTLSSGGNTFNPSSYVGVFKSFSNDPSIFFSNSNMVSSEDEEGSVLFLEVPEESGSEFLFFIFENNSLVFRRGIGANREYLMNNVEKVSFRYQEGIVIYYIDLDTEEYEGKVRDSYRNSASTRIDF